MNLKQHFDLLATYNKWMNEKIYDTASSLSESALIENRGAFFNSILGTLNHIVVGDTIWLKRFATHPASSNALQEIFQLPTPSGLDQLLFEDIGSLHAHRKWLDEHIISWISELSESDLDYILSYRNTKGVPACKRLSFLILHFFNHQAHHRGQVSTLLSQAGLNVGVTDLLALIPEEPT